MTQRNLILISLVTLWGTLVGCSTVGAPVALDAHTDLAIFHAHSDPGEATRCAPGADCVEVDVDDVECGGATADVVVIAGESSPPAYLGHSPQSLAGKIACVNPRLIVLDTSYGFSAPLLHALAVYNVDAVVVGSTGPVGQGLSYGEGFYAPEMGFAARAALVSTDDGALEVWRVNRTEIEASLAAVDGSQFEWLVSRSSGAMTRQARDPHPSTELVVAVEAGLRQ